MVHVAAGAQHPYAQPRPGPAAGPAGEPDDPHDEAAGTAVPKIAKLIQTPTIRPETILEVAASIDAQAKGIEEAVRYGQERRAEVVTAIVTARESMSASSEHLDRTVVELVARAQRPLELPAAPTLPAVLDQAAHVPPTFDQGSGSIA